MAKVTTRQISALSPYLEGDKPTHININKETGEQTREWNLKCPLHDDQTRSASLNVDKGVFWCARCGGMSVVELIRRKPEWRQVLNGNGARPVNLEGQPSTRPVRTLTEGLIAGWHSALLSNEGALQWLNERRGITLDTVRRYEIGIENGKYTIPVRSPDRDIWNVRFYNPNPRGEARKIWSETGYGSPNRLYPISVFDKDPREIIIGEGEWDILLALQSGYAAVTRTGAADVWSAEWGEWFKDRIVYLAHDADDKGQKANRVVGRALMRIADVRVIKLPYTILPKHGKDLTDLILDEGPEALHDLMAAAQPFAKRKVEAEVPTISVLDTQDARRVGKPVRVVVTIKGRKEPGYTVPHKVLLACTQDAGTKCLICPLRSANGEARVEVSPDNPLILSMIEASAGSMNQTIAESYGIPGGKCGKLALETEEHQAVEVLFARPSLDHVDGADTRPDAAQYKTIKITSVGRHDTPPNNTVSVVGSLQPNPRSQANEFLAHSLEQVATSRDRFDVTRETVALMKRFQATGQPLKKLAEVDKHLAQHVTRIHGRPEMHALMDVVFHSVRSFYFAGEFVQRGWLEALIVGDTRTGKSVAAERLVRHYGAGEIINCETASFAGVVGGLQQLGGKEWVVTWGAVPLNDGGLVVLDEVSGLTPEEIAQMSDIRSSGQAKLVKIQQETTWARTRMLWMGNPRNSAMANFTYGVDAIRPLIGNAEDIARFDIAMALTQNDVAAETINQPAAEAELRYTTEACHTLLMWVWTRTPDQIVFGREAERKVFDLANEMGKLYIEDPPLIQAANVRIKIARLAAAIAGRLFSTDAEHEKLIVLPTHVEAAGQFINLLYGMPTFGYRERSKERLEDRYFAEKNRDWAGKYLKGRPLLMKFLRGTGKFRRQDLEEILGVSKEEANSIISELYEHRMVRKVLGDVVVEPTLHAVLRERK